MVLLVGVVWAGTPAPAHAGHYEGSDGNYMWCALRISSLGPGAVGGSEVTQWASCTVPDVRVFSDGAAGSVFGFEWARWSVCGEGTPTVTSFTGSAYSEGEGTAMARATATGTISEGACIGAGTLTPRPFNGVTTRNLSDGDQQNHAHNSSHPGVVVHWEVGTGFPPYPAVGGGMPPPGADPGLLCSATLSPAPTGSLGVAFDAVTQTATPEGYTDEFAWWFGESGYGGPADETGPGAWHVYPGYRDDTGQAWQAVVRVTRDGPAPPENPVWECVLDVDGYGPRHITGDGAPVDPTSEPGSGTPPGGGGSTVPDDEPDCRGWDLVCFLRFWLVPQSAPIQERVEEAQDQMQTRWPVAPMLWATDRIASLRTEVSSTAGGTEHGTLIASTQGCAPGHTRLWVRVPLAGDLTVDIQVAACGPGHPMWTMQRAIRGMMTVTVVLLWLLWLRGLATRLVGGGGQ